MTLTVGQKVVVFDGTYRGGAKRFDGEVTRVGRKLVTVQWNFGGFSPTDATFRIETGQENDQWGRRWFKTVEQAEADDRLAEAKRVLREADVIVGHRCLLTDPQIEELSAIVRNMLAEKPANHESEIAGR